MSYIDEARHFEENEKPFHLGFLPTEQSNPLTAHLDEEFAKATTAGVRNLQLVDREVLKMARRILASDGFRKLVDLGEKTIRSGNRIIFSGCGATGRLSILLEAMWKNACRRHGRMEWYGQVESIMTGGDFALVKSVESFEDYAIFGAQQVIEAGMTADDLLVAITEGGETSSVLGTVAEAAGRGAKAFLLFNNPADLLAANLERSRNAIENPAVTVLDLFCGPMAIAGSTRMQATTSEQLISSAALEAIFCRLSGEAAPADPAGSFAALLDEVESEAAVAGIARYIDLEEDIYRRNGHVTYFAGEYMLDIFTDTTERSPTFMLPGFKFLDDTVSPEPWAFARDPRFDAPGALCAALEREPRCLEWNADFYRASGSPEKLISNPPAIGRSALERIPVGKGELPMRSSMPADTAVEFAVGSFNAELEGAFAAESAVFPNRVRLLLGGSCDDADVISVPFRSVPTRLRVFEHLGVKVILNTISTGTMAKLGRISGNWMSFVAVSNKKLIDRAIRLISELGGIDYHTACVELFRSIEELESFPAGAEKPSSVQYTLKRVAPERVRQSR